MALEWITPEEASKKWGIKVRRVQELCSKGKVTGATRFGRVWMIPLNAPKPIDGRTKAAKSRQDSELGGI